MFDQWYQIQVARIKYKLEHLIVYKMSQMPNQGQ